MKASRGMSPSFNKAKLHSAHISLRALPSQEVYSTTAQQSIVFLRFCPVIPFTT